MEFEFLKSLVVIFLASAIVVFLLHKFRVPSLVGFIIAGVIIGPYSIGIVKDTHAIEMLAEIGVILLLFTIGIEFSMAKLIRIKKAVIGGGGIQVLLTIALSSAIAYIATQNINKSIFIGFLIALSSTAIVLKLLAEKGETDSPHGRVMVGILIFQDLCIVPLMLLVPSLSGEGIDFMEIITKMIKAILIIAVVLLGARWVIPYLLHQVVHTKSRELFIMTIILICLGIALLTSKFGLSLALGAFLAGLIISESEYAHQAISDILPFKDSFIGLFFVSVGMLLDISYVFDNMLTIGIILVIIFGIKFFTGSIAPLFIGTPLRPSLQAGLGIAQIGEFSFVLALAGKSAGIITEDFYQIFLSSSIVTMIVTPFMLNAAPSVSEWITSRHMFKRLDKARHISESGGFPKRKHGHVVIIGFGLNGRNLARVLKEADVPYVVLEMNSDTVLQMKREGEPIYYGDGTSQEILHKLHIQKARLLVIAISDPASTRRIVSIARHENPDIYIIVRTRYLAEVDDLKSLGANEVIPEEFETSIEIFSRVMQQYKFPQNIIYEMIDKVRNDNYTALRGAELPRSHLFDKCEWLPEIAIDGYKISETSILVEKSIKDLQIRRKRGVTVIAVRRGQELYTNPEPDFRFERGDLVLYTGNREKMQSALKYFKGEE